LIVLKKLLRTYLIYVVVIYLSALIIPGLTYGEDLFVLLIAALVFGLVNALARPVVKLVLLPLNFLTLGVLSWITGVLMLYITTILVPGFEVQPFDFTGFVFSGITIEPRNVSYLESLVGSALVMSQLNRFIYWII
jgi:putative membrane protein